MLAGSNVTVTDLDAPAARLWPDAVSADFANWDASVPVIAIVPMVRLADPVFVIVKTCVGLAAEANVYRAKCLRGWSYRNIGRCSSAAG